MAGAVRPEVAFAKRPPEPVQAPGVLVDVRDHGAVGDGIADDTAAIQAAIDSAAYTDDTRTTWRGASVYFPPGVYLISSTLTLHSYTGLVGEPGWMSRIRLADGADCDMVSTLTDGTYNEYQAIENMCFDGNRWNQSVEAHGLRFFESTRPHLTHCLVTEVKGYAIHMSGTSSLTMQPMLSYCVVVNSGNGIGLLSGCTDALIHACDVGSNTYGMVIQSGAHVILGGTLWGNWVGAQTTTAHVTFNGVRVDQNQAHGLEFTTADCQNCQVTGCSIYWNGQNAANTYSGVHVHNGANNLLVGASMIGSVYSDGGSETQAYGVFADATTTGIELGANMLRANLTEGARLLGS
jgi:polygalacturonase